MIIYDQAHNGEHAEDFQTYDEWKKDDYHVRKGETSYARNDDGVALFHISQVDENFSDTDPSMWMDLNND